MEEVNNFKYCSPQIHINISILNDDESTTELEFTNPYRLRIVNSLCVDYCNDMIKKYGTKIKAQIDINNEEEFLENDKYYEYLENDYKRITNLKYKF